MNLQEVTGQESGIVIFNESKEMIICNWSSVDGIPRLAPAGLGILGLNEEIEITGTEEIDDIGAYLENRYGGQLRLLWDVNNNIEDLYETIGKLYEIQDDIIVIAPEEWC